MSELGDTLNEQDKTGAKEAKLTITVDAVITAADPTFAIRLEGPSFSEVVLDGVAVADLPAAIAEFTDWVASRWT